VVASLPAKHRQRYAGYVGEVRRSPWANWKPKGDPPYKVAVSYAMQTNAYQVEALEVLEAALKRNPDIGEVSVKTLNSVNVPEQLQQFSALLNEDPDIIISQPLQPEPFVPLVKKAADAGIPTVVMQGSIPSVYAVNVQSNNYVAAGQSAAALAQLLGGKGNVLLMHGFPTVQVDIEEFKGFRAVLKRCPQIKVVGETLGAFSPVTAKEQTLKFLTTHPGRVDGVMQTALMSTGIMSAFEQAGRDVPIVTDVAAQKGALGYWRQNKGKYRGTGIGLGAAPVSLATASVVRRMLDGRGPKLTDITDTLPVITDENLDDWAEPGWTLRTPGQAEGPKNEFLTEEYLEPLFTEPGASRDGG
jgi:ribose transport system substrate-binding protein